MKKTLTIIIASVAMFFATDAFAQMSASVGFASSRTNFDIASLTNMKMNMGGVYGGLSYNIPLSESASGVFGMAPGIYVSYLMKDNAGLAVVKGKISESYLTVPFDFNYTFPVADGTKFIIYAGPSLSCGLSSNISVDALTKFGENAGLSSVVGSRNDMYDGIISQYIGYDRFDLLLGGGIAMEFEDMIRVNIGYDAGLLNRGGNYIGVHRNQFQAGVAVLF